jgi:hypothetical protein
MARSASKILVLSTCLAAFSYAEQDAFKCTGTNPAATYNASITSLGCWTDATVRTLNGKETTSANNDPQSCANTCGYLGYNISGVEYTTFVNSPVLLRMDKLTSTGNAFAATQSTLLPRRPTTVPAPTSAPVTLATYVVVLICMQHICSLKSAIASC